MIKVIILIITIYLPLSAYASQVRIDVHGIADYINPRGEILPNTPYSATFLYETNTTLAIDTFDQPRIENNLIYEFEHSPYFGSIIIGDVANPIFIDVFTGIFVGVTDGSLENQFIAALSPDTILDRDTGFIIEGILIQILFEFTDTFNSVDSILREAPSGSSFRFAFQETREFSFSQQISDNSPNSVTFTPVPLPGALILLSAGFLGLLRLGRLKK